MAAPLIAMMVQGAIRLATPTVAKLLTKSGFKKAAKEATKNASKITQKEAKKLAKKPPKKPSMIKETAQQIKRDIKEDPMLGVQLGTVATAPPTVEVAKRLNKEYAKGGGVRKAKFMDN